MAIAGLLIHTLAEHAKQLEISLNAVAGISTYGIHQDCYIVAVADVESSQIEKLISSVEKVEHVLAVYLSSLNTEDENE